MENTTQQKTQHVQNSSLNNECNGILGKLFGHKFEPRFDTEEKINHNMPQLNYDNILPVFLDDYTQHIESYKDIVKKYKCDVCIRCGKVIENENSN